MQKTVVEFIINSAIHYFMFLEVLPAAVNPNSILSIFSQP